MTASADRARLEALYAEHAAAVHAYARRRTDPASAEDLVAETFLVAWRRLQRVPPDALPWLYATAGRLLANQRRGEARRAALTARIGRERTLAAVAVVSAGAWGGSELSDDGERLLRALASLRPTDREALLLTAWEGLEPARAAAAAGCSKAAFHVRLHRAQTAGRSAGARARGVRRAGRARSRAGRDSRTDRGGARMSDLLDRLRALDPERDGTSGAPPLGWLRALLDVEPEPPRRHRRPVAVAVALACLAALALAAAAILGGSSAAPRRDRDALVPAHDGEVIVHVVARTTIGTPRGGRGGAEMEGIGTLSGPVERWSLSPARWRQRATLLPWRGLPGGWIDTTYADGLLSSRDSRRRAVHHMRVPPPGARVEPALMFGAPLGRGGSALLTGVADPRATVAAMIGNGEVRPAGEITSGGRRLLRLRGATTSDRNSARAMVPGTRTQWLVDADSHVPVELDSLLVFDYHARAVPQFGQGSRTVFEVYETLPLTDATERFLRLGGPTR